MKETAAAFFMCTHYIRRLLMTLIFLIGFDQFWVEML